MDFGHCRLSIAGPNECEYDGIKSLENTKIATSYVHLLNDFLKSNSITAETVYFSGAVEIAPKLGKADFICDLVSTGSTLEANGMREVDELLQSEAVVIQTRAALSAEKQALVAKLLQRSGRCLTGSREQVHHVARAACRLAGDP